MLLNSEQICCLRRQEGDSKELAAVVAKNPCLSNSAFRRSKAQTCHLPRKAQDRNNEMACWHESKPKNKFLVKNVMKMGIFIS